MGIDLLDHAFLSHFPAHIIRKSSLWFQGTTSKKDWGLIASMEGGVCSILPRKGCLLCILGEVVVVLSVTYLIATLPLSHIGQCEGGDFFLKDWKTIFDTITCVVRRSLWTESKRTWGKMLCHKARYEHWPMQVDNWAKWCGGAEVSYVMCWSNNCIASWFTSLETNISIRYSLITARLVLSQHEI